MLIVPEQNKPPFRGLKLEILNQSPSYLHVCHNNALSWGAALETVLKGQISLNVWPYSSNDLVFKKLPDQLPIVVREDVSEDQEALPPQGSVELLTGRSLKLVLLL